MDTPQLTVELMVAAVRAVTDDGAGEPSAEACFGPAADGGWWLLGLRRPDPGLLLGVPMSQPTTGAATRQRLGAAGLSVLELPVLRDVDTPADAAAVAAQVPDSRFGATHAALVRAAARRAS
jgi:glycosyltransferase A (GT-A) superfamily protein (DUF2064 family)